VNTGLMLAYVFCTFFRTLFVALLLRGVPYRSFFFFHADCLYGWPWRAVVFHLLRRTHAQVSVSAPSFVLCVCENHT